MNSQPDIVPLTYAISGATPHSGIYRPENILVDKPQDAASRWSGALQGTNQYIMLRLESLAVLSTFLFTHSAHLSDQYRVDLIWQGKYG